VITEDKYMKKVLVGGSFDILHSGHLELLKIAKSYGDYLVVMLTSDERIRYKKHHALPIYNQEDRKNIIESLKMVDEAIIIDDEPNINIAIKALKLIKPDIYVRTNEVNKETFSEEVALCNKLCIEIILIDRLVDVKYRSSSRIIKYIVDNFIQKDMESLIIADETK
jgi:cytidyltransferase-like protein